MKSAGTFQAIDTTFELRAPSAMAARLADAYGDVACTTGTRAAHVIELRRSPLGWTTAMDGRQRTHGMSASAAVLDTRRAINDLAESSAAATDTVLNASAIEIEGGVIAIVGPIVSGKSSLTLELAHRGHGFVADDVTAVRDDGVVRPFHRPVGVRLQVADDLGVQVPKGPYKFGYPVRMGSSFCLSTGGPLRLIVLARRGDQTFSEPLTPSWALMRMASDALRAAGHERVMFSRFGRLLEKVPAVNLWHDDKRDAIAELERLAAAYAPG